MKLMSDEGCPDRSMRVRSALGMLERIQSFQKEF